MRFLIATLLLGACGTEADDYPVLPDDTTPPPTTSAATLSGRICVIADARDLATCSATGAGGLVVSAGSSIGLTRSDGSFTLAAPEGATMLTVAGAGVVPTQLSLRSDLSAAPVLLAALYEQMLAANGVSITPGTGAILASVTRNGEPVSGVRVTTAPVGASGPFFDGTTATGFTLDGTGTRGIVWAPGIVAGPTSLTFSDLASSGETTVGGVQVVDGGLTLTDAVLP